MFEVKGKHGLLFNCKRKLYCYFGHAILPYLNGYYYLLLMQSFNLNCVIFFIQFEIKIYSVSQNMYSHTEAKKDKYN